MGVFPHSPSDPVARTQLEVVVDGHDEVLPGVLVEVLGGLVVDLPSDLAVDRRSRGLVLLDGHVDVLPGGLVDDLLQVVVLAPATAPICTQHSSTLRRFSVKIYEQSETE